MKDKILKYDQFLLKNRQELDSRELQQQILKSENAVRDQNSNPQNANATANNVASGHHNRGVPSFSEQSSIKQV